MCQRLIVSANLPGWFVLATLLGACGSDGGAADGTPDVPDGTDVSDGVDTAPEVAPDAADAANDSGADIADDAHSEADSGDGADAVNLPPGEAVVTIAPTTPTTLDALRAQIIAEAIDPDGDTVSYTFTWTRDGEPTTHSTAEVPASATVRGERWRVVVTASDGELSGLPTSAEVVIENAAPSGGAVTLDPTTVREGERLTCVPSGAVDPDGDDVTWVFAWSVDDVALEVADMTLGSEHFDRDQRVTCSATPTDGVDFGPTLVAEPAVILNSEPVIAGAALSPGEATRADTLTCAFDGWSDPDPADGQPQVAYAWFVGEPGAGGQIPGATSATLTPSTQTPGDRVYCAVTPLNPGLVPDRGTTVNSPSILIVNRLPSLSELRIEPLTPRVDSVLTCTPVGASDPDNDPVTFTYTWTRNNTPIAEATTSTLNEAFAKGDVIRCHATPNDPFGAGLVIASNPNTILNTAPTGGYANLTPTEGVREGTTLTCAGSTATDADGDDVTWEFTWSVDDLANNVTTATLTGAHFNRGQRVRCAAIPFDGSDRGATLNSEPVTVANSAPSLSSATSSPPEVPRAGTLTCAYTGWSDPDPADGQPQVSYAWFVGQPGAGTAIPGAANATFVPSSRTPGDRVYCAVIPLNPGLAPDRGTTVTSSPSLVINRVPTLTEVRLAPLTPRVDSVLTCTPLGGSDPDNDSVTFTYTWTRNNTPINNATTSTLSAAFAKGDVIRCNATPNDPFGAGLAVASAPVTVLNTAPTGGYASLSPTESVHEGTTLTCSGSAATDADADDVTWEFTWSVDDLANNVTTATLTGAHFNRGQRVRCAAIPFDGSDRGATLNSEPVTVANSAPSLSSATSSPPEVPRAGTLTCAYTGWSDPDPADGQPQVSYAWFVGQPGAGTAIPGATNATFVPSSRTPGDRVYCAVIPLNPGLAPDRGTTVTSSPSLVVNRVPSLSEVRLAPLTPRVDSVLTCAPVGPTDPDNDAVTFTYTWTRNNTPIANATGETLSGAFAKGDAIRCHATPRDPFGAGAAVASAPVTVLNTAPTGGYADLTPTSNVREGTTLTCGGWAATDSDGDDLTWEFTWSVDDVANNVTTATLSSAHFDRGQIVRCSATPFDGTDRGPTLRSEPVTVGNSAPSLSSATSSPPEVPRAGTLTCAYAGWSDPDPADGQPQVAYAWFVGQPGAGTAIPGATSATFVPSSRTPGDRVYCAVTPLNAGLVPDRGTTVNSASSLVVNRVPTLTEARLEPVTPRVDTVLTCTPVGPTDPDNDPVAFTYTWTKNNTPINNETAPTLSEAFAKGDVIRCHATLRDPFGAGAAVASAPITILNTPPAGGYAGLTPNEDVREGTTLTCSGSAATDINNDDITWEFTWSVDDATLDITTATLSSAHFDRGQLVRCSATPFDGTDRGATLNSESVTIANSAPSLSSATSSPSEVPRAGTLTCAYAGWSDPDPADGSPQVSYAWFVGQPGAGTAIPGATSATLVPSSRTPGDRVYCAVTPLNAGLVPDRGTTVNSASSLVVNRVPTLAEARLEPLTPRVDSVLSCTPVGATDPDNDNVTFTYTWTKNNTPIANATTSTLSEAFAKGDVIRCHATPRDPFGAGAAVASAPITILNTAPTGGYASLTPNEDVREGTTLTCSGSAATDINNDDITWELTWSVDDAALDITTATLASAHFDRGQIVRCSATPFDGTDRGPTLNSEPVTIANSAPSLSSATSSPTEVPRAGTLTCAFEGWSDPDPADAQPQVSYAWFVGEPGAGTQIPGATNATFAPSSRTPGERVSCAVTPLNPGLAPDRGTTVTSAPSLVVNRVPSLSEVRLAPLTPRVDSVLTCTPVGPTDPDNDAVTFTYTWTKNNNPIANATTSTLSEAFAKGDVIRCHATPNDAFGAGVAVASPPFTILNTAPTLTTLALTPDPASPCATFTCTPGAIVDPDIADTHTTTFRWTVDDLPVAHTAASWSPSDLTPGRRIRCHASTSDDSHPSPELASNEVTTTNTPPTLTSVSISPSPTAQAGSTLTCVPTGYTDPECAPTPDYTWRWFNNGAPLDTTTATLSTAGLAVGDALSCEATPRDRWTSGTPRASNAVTLTNIAPTTPVVLVTAPSGVAGPITCELVVPSADTEPLAYTWHWQLGADPSFTGPQVLEQVVTDCDRVRCWATVTDGYATVTSGASQLVLPFGPACEDFNDCTDDTCAPGGGCQYTNHTRSCADDELCNGAETCQDGACQSGLAVDCGGVTNRCLESTCNPATGACDLPRPEGWPCPDADLCDGYETCLSGVCTQATPIDCASVTNPCLQQTCNPQTGACDLPRPDGTTCDDDEACTWNDACEGGACVAEPICGCDLTTGLLLWYDFETALQDKSGNGRHATPAKIAAYVDALIGSGLVFDGGQHLTVQDGKILGPTTSRSRTIAFWAKPTVRGTAVMNQYQDTSSDNSSFFIAPNGAPSWQISGNGTNVLQSSIGPLDTWEHVAVVFVAGANRTVIYRNGAEVARGSLNYPEAQSTRDTKVGEGLGSLGNFRGTLDELRVYDRELSADDIATLAATSCDTPPPDCGCAPGWTGPDCSEPVTACASLYLGGHLYHRGPLTGPVPTTIWIGFQAISKGIQNAGVIIDNARVFDTSTQSLLFEDPFDVPANWLTRSGGIGQAKVEGGQGLITADWGGFERTGPGTAVPGGHFSVQFDTYWGPNTDGVQIVIHRSNTSLPTWDDAWLWGAIGLGEYASGESDAAALLALNPGQQSPIVADSSTPITQPPANGWHVFSLRIEPGDCEPASPLGVDPNTCEPPTATACEAIELAQPSAPSGVYPIDIDGDGPLPELPIWCDLTTDGGGWTRVFGHRVTTSTPAVPIPHADIAQGLAAASTESGYIAPAQLATLIDELGATELRLTCGKSAHPRVIDIKTQSAAVLAWLTGQSNTQPLATGSFTRLPADTATLSQQPSQWGWDGTSSHVGKWGHVAVQPNNRLVHAPMFIFTSNHWHLTTDRSECDDWINTQSDPRGYWHIYVR